MKYGKIRRNVMAALLSKKVGTEGPRFGKPERWGKCRRAFGRRQTQRIYELHQERWRDFAPGGDARIWAEQVH
jgi:hypothetical protein